MDFYIHLPLVFCVLMVEQQTQTCQEIPFLINDMDEHEKHCLYVKRPYPNEPPIHYRVSFPNKKGESVHHTVRIAYNTPYYEMTVKGRFVITRHDTT